MPLTVTTFCVGTEFVLIGNVAEVWPWDTVTLEGTITAELLLVSLTVVPAVGAITLSVTVPVEVVPPVTAVGLIFSDVIGGPEVFPVKEYKYPSYEPIKRLPSAAIAGDEVIEFPVV